MRTEQAGPGYSLEDRYTAEEGRVYLTGVQALVRVLLDHRRIDARAGRRTAGFVSGYPGSPLAGLDKELQRNRELLEAHDVVHRPGVNEELGCDAVIGSQMASAQDGIRFDGVAGMWYGKAPGLDRAGDALKHGNYIGASAGGGVLATVGDDPSSKSSTLPSGSEVAFYDALMPVLFPGDVQEVLDLGLHGLRLSRTSGLWAGFKIVTNVADAAEVVDVDPSRLRFVPVDRPGAHPVPKPNGYLLPPHNLEAERQIHELRLPLALEYARLNELNRIAVASPGAWIGVVAAGRTYHDLRQALQELGLPDPELERRGIRLLKVSMPYPFDAELARRFADGLEEIVVAEDKRAFLELFVKDALYGVANAPRVVGKTDEAGASLFASHGALDADTIARGLASRLSRRIDVPSVAARVADIERVAARVPLTVLPKRMPYYCSGCPHNRSSQVPEDTLVGGGIGCHGMVLWMPQEQVGDVTGLTQMGGEGAQFIGMAPFVDAPHFVQNLGDGTFFHSGHLAVRAAVASGVTLTYKILYNSAVAMTGGQDAPGALPIPELTRLLQLEGVRRIVVSSEDPKRYRRARLATNAVVYHRDRLLDAQRELAEVSGVTVLIHDGQCAAEKRRLRKRGKLATPATRVVINERVCEGCGDCGRKSNCLSLEPVETEFGTKTHVHQGSCNIDESCLLGDCPSFVTVTVTPKRTRKKPAAKAEPAQPPVPDLPEPVLRVPSDDWAVRMVGIGGTGVVTVSQVLGTAAMLEGRLVSGLDQTGLAQKGGPVVSDLRITRGELAPGVKLSAAGADLLLAFDALTACSPVNLATASPERTIAVVSTAETATGEMVNDNRVAQPEPARIREMVDAVTREEHNVYLDPAAVAEGVLGSHMLANVVSLGAAVQAGAVPLRPESIERALELNGASVAANLAAFRWGRALVAAPEATSAALAERAPTPPDPVDPATRERLAGLDLPSELHRLLELRVADLVAYQSRAYAETYLGFVLEVLETERRAVAGSSALAEAVARNLYKLMAYKDEYEVARLHLDPAFGEAIAADLGDVRKVTYHLHPPFLRAMGLKRKLRLGPSSRPMLRALRAGRRLRGTWADPFGRSHVRRVERMLIDGYREAVTEALPMLTPGTLGVAVRLAGLPDMIRGYERIKLDNVEAYRVALREAAAELEGAQPATA